MSRRSCSSKGKHAGMPGASFQPPRGRGCPLPCHGAGCRGGELAPGAEEILLLPSREPGSKIKSSAPPCCITHRSSWSCCPQLTDPPGPHPRTEWPEQELARGARCPGEMMGARPPVGKGHLSPEAVTVTLAFREAYRIMPVSCRPRAVSLSLPLKTDSAPDWNIRPLRLEKGQ